jgi:hypothetical protein
LLVARGVVRFGKRPEAFGVVCSELLVGTLVVGAAASALTPALAFPPPPVVHEHILYEIEKESSPRCTITFGRRFGDSMTKVSATFSSSAIKHQPSKRHFRQPLGGDHRSKE